MRVLFVVRTDAFTKRGGDMVQAEATKRGLESAGVTVDLAATLDPDARGYDIAHIFGVFEPQKCAQQIAACRRAGARVALSPIWWDLEEFFARSPHVARILSGAAWRIPSRLVKLRATPAQRLSRPRERRRFEQRLRAQSELLAQADVLLPNSAIEAFCAMKILRVTGVPMVAVVNPVEVRDDTGAARGREGVVCIARIEPKKNQAMLLYALRDVDVPVTLIGACYEPEYLEVCKRWMTPRVQWLGDLAHDEVLRRIRNAAVHALPSWGETPGIASLEAAAAGARIIVGNDGSQFEYFGPHARYVDPQHPQAIREAVQAALREPPRDPADALHARLRNFNTATIARQTLEAYQCALTRTTTP
jgi:glycosyltransferase involved in cell wall biosynthesis